jgi:mRNA interferase MazF
VNPPPRGEVWLVDLGMAAKVRPAVVLSVPAADTDRALVTLVSHTTSRRNTAYEVPVPAPFLKPGAFDAQGIASVPLAKLIRRLGRLTPEQLALVEAAVRRWLALGRDMGEGGA